MDLTKYLLVQFTLLLVNHVFAENKSGFLTLSVCDNYVENITSSFEDETKEFYFPVLGRICEAKKQEFKFEKTPLLCNNADIANNSFKLSIKLELKNVCNKTTLKNIKFMDTGKFIVQQNTYERDEYCVSSLSDEGITFLICNQTCSERRPCISQCCNDGRLLDFSNVPQKAVSCAKLSGQPWTPTLYSTKADRILTEEESSNLRPIFLRFYQADVEQCMSKGSFYFSPARNVPNVTPRRFKIMQDGTVQIRCKRRMWKQMPPGLFCVNGLTTKSPSLGHSGFKEDVTLMDCDLEVCNIDDKGLHETSSIYGTTLLISGIFFLLTAAVYLVLPEKHTLQGWTTVGYLLAMTANLCFLAVNKFKHTFFMLETRNTFFTGCCILGIAGHFALLSGFTWMTIFGFDIWSNFRTLQIRKKSLKRLYVIYIPTSIIIPSSIVLLGVIMDLWLKDDMYSDEFIIPEYGTDCFVSNSSLLSYIYGPMAILLTINLSFFIHTILSLARSRKETEFASSSSTKVQNRKMEAIFLYGKLMFLMGIPWIIEIVTWALADDVHIMSNQWLTVISDNMIIGQSILVFFIFVLLHKDTMTSLKTKFPILKTTRDFFSTTSSKIGTQLCKINSSDSCPNIDKNTTSNTVSTNVPIEPGEGGIELKEMVEFHP